MHRHLLVFVFLSVVVCAFSTPRLNDLLHDDKYMHTKYSRLRDATHKIRQQETSDFWISNAQQTLEQRLGLSPVVAKAKNVIFFLGDGMSIPTITASRIFGGQRNGQPGEEYQLFFETLPYTGLVKTYCVSHQVADSACSATAYLTGVKNNKDTIGISSAVLIDDCNGMMNESNHATSILKWAQDAGMATGIVTTTRITHATPAGTYAHTANRDWESDRDMPSSDTEFCDDIAEQLVNNEVGRNFNVILGGGRDKFVDRNDGKNLITEWSNAHKEGGYYVSNRDELLRLVPANTNYVLGLLNGDHMSYNADANRTVEPSLTEMVSKAMDLLSKDSSRSYFLFVEGGRIDHGHHDNYAQRACDETLEFDKAIKMAASRTDPKDTLLVVTADHAHTMSINGYPERGNPIFGLGSEDTADNLPYTTLTYANGPGYLGPNNNHRYDISDDDTMNINYQQQSYAPISSETHGGDDVAIYARGPFAHLLTGTMEQNFIPHAVAYAACIGPGKTYCG